MAKIIDINTSYGRMRPTSAVRGKSVEPSDAGAGDGTVSGMPARPRSGMSFASLAENISRQLASSGGRPALEGAVGRKKIPLQSGDWQCLERAVARLHRQGVRSSAGQVASVLLHEQIERLDAPAPKTAGRRRETGRR